MRFEITQRLPSLRSAGSKKHASALCAGVAGLLLTLGASGCAVMPIADVPSEKTSPAIEQEPPAPGAPWGSEDGSTVVIEFERDGETHTVRGEIPLGLISCQADGRIAIASKLPDPGIGVMFQYEAATPVSTSAWVVGEEFAAQILATGTVALSPDEAEGQTFSVVGATGRASVLPREAGKDSIGEYEFGPDDQVEATSSFIVTCPAP